MGKSRILRSMVEEWVRPSDDGELGFTDDPNVGQIVVVSYSPFEQFPVDLVGVALSDRDVYKYLGFRGRGEPVQREDRDDVKSLGAVELSHDFPKINAARSLLACVVDDQRYGAIKDWPGKINTVENVLRTTIDFDVIAVCVDTLTDVSRFNINLFHPLPAVIDIVDDLQVKRYLPLTSANVDLLNTEMIEGALQPQEGLTFFKGAQPVMLSSGQQLFSYIVTNILGAIKRNSLILVDEPELFLHPTLEIQFVEMLKTD